MTSHQIEDSAAEVAQLLTMFEAPTQTAGTVLAAGSTEVDVWEVTRGS